MILVQFLFGAAFLLATAAGFFSVAGLATTYGGSFAAVVALGATIELGKLVGVSFLYRFWHHLSIVFRTTMSAMIIGVMVVTSLGVFGFLTKANQTDMVGLRQSMTKIELLADEEQRLIARKTQIDQQIAQLPSESVNSRVRLTRQFKTELDEINTRLPAITRERAEARSAQIEQQADIGPLVFIAKALGYDVDVAVTWFTLLLVAVFDPLAVMLTICANIALAHHKRGTTEPPVRTPVVDAPTEAPEPELVMMDSLLDVIRGVQFAPKPLHSADDEPLYDFAAFDDVSLVSHHRGPVFRDKHSDVPLDDASRVLLTSDWNHYVNRQVKTSDISEMQAKIAQLKLYVAELDERANLTEDELILRSRIVNFIERNEQAP